MQSSRGQKLVAGALIIGMAISPFSVQSAFANDKKSFFSMHEKSLWGEKMAGPEGVQITAQNITKEKPKPIVVPVKVRKQVMFSEFDALLKTELAPKASIKLEYDKTKKERPEVEARKAEVVGKIEKYINTLLERYPELKDALPNMPNSIHVELMNTKMVDEQSRGQNQFGDNAFVSMSTIGVNIEGGVRNYDLAAASAFLLLYNYPAGGFKTKAEVFDAGSFDLFAARLLGGLGGKAKPDVESDGVDLVMEALASAMGPSSFISAYLKSDIETAASKFDAKFGKGAFAKVTNAPEESSPNEELVKIIRISPNFAGMKNDIRKAAAGAGYTIGDDLFRAQ